MAYLLNVDDATKATLHKDACPTLSMGKATKKKGRWERVETKEEAHARYGSKTWECKVCRP